MLKSHLCLLHFCSIPHGRTVIWAPLIWDRKMSQCDPSSFLRSFPGQTTINGAWMGSSSIKEWQNNSNLLASHQVGAEGSSQERLPLLSMFYQESDYWQSVHENSKKLQRWKLPVLSPIFQWVQVLEGLTNMILDWEHHLTMAGFELFCSEIVSMLCLGLKPTKNTFNGKNDINLLAKFCQL